MAVTMKTPQASSPVEKQWRWVETCVHVNNRKYLAVIFQTRFQKDFNCAVDILGNFWFL